MHTSTQDTADANYMLLTIFVTRVRMILVSGIKYQPILAVSASIDICSIFSLYSHMTLVSSDCCEVITAAAFD